MLMLVQDSHFLARCRLALVRCTAAGADPAMLVGCLAIGGRGPASALANGGQQDDVKLGRSRGCATPASPGLGASTLPAVSLLAARTAYLDHLTRAHCTASTRTVRAAHLGLFCAWAATQGLTVVGAITREVLERYQDHLLRHRTRRGSPLSLSSQHTRLVHLRAWWTWLVRTHGLPCNPARDLTPPRLGAPLPPVLGVADAERVLLQPNVTTRVGMRDRAILEMFYATGMRRTELRRLSLVELDRPRGLVTIRDGKGRRDRVVPLGGRAVGWLDRYITTVRPSWVRPPDPGTLFLTARGVPLHPNHLSALVHGYVKAAQLGTRGACHLFRHTMATLMLEGGADIRFIQQMLGHAKLTTTQLYTHVSIRQLQAVHAATHPAVRGAGRGETGGSAM